MARHPASAVRPDDIRAHNLSLVLTHIHHDGALTRAQLTQRLDLSRSTVGALVGELTQLGLVEEVVPSGGTRVGRPSHLVAPGHAAPFAVAVDIEVARVTIAGVGLGGRILARSVIEETGGALEPSVLVLQVAEAIDGLRRSLAPMEPCGIGVSVPGTVDLDGGRVGVAPNLGWERVELGEALTAGTGGLPVAVGNDADLAVLAERQWGSARGWDDVVYLMGRIGVGAGIIVGGSPLRGRDGHAGEIGHNVLDPEGPPCHCGKRGCLETYIGDAALLAHAARSRPPSEQAMVDLFAAAGAGEADALAAVRSAAEPLGRAIANLLNTLNLGRVLLGGSITELIELIRDDVEAAVARYTFGSANRDVELVAPGLGADSALLGAAEIAFARLLSDPH